MKTCQHRYKITNISFLVQSGSSTDIKQKMVNLCISTMKYYSATEKNVILTRNDTDWTLKCT